MLKKNKTKLIVSSLITLLPALVGMILWNQLPEQMPTHWSIGGEIDGWGSKSFAIFGTPLLMLLTHWICIGATMLDKRNWNQNAKPMGIVLFIFPFVSLLMSATMYSAAFGKQIDMTVITPLLMGLLFIFIGNYLPKCRQNATLGIKIHWTLANEENWNRTHRFGGRAWVIGGALLMLAAFLPGNAFTAAMIVLFLLMIFAPMLYSYLLYRRQKADGTWEVNGVILHPTAKRLSIVFTIVILIFVAVLMFTGNINYSFGEDSLAVKASYWPDSTIPYANIDSIEYRETRVDGVRTSGFGSARLLMGQFNNDEFGYYTRYTYTGCDAAIVLTIDGRVIVLSGKDESSTLDLYNDLTNRISDN